MSKTDIQMVIALLWAIFLALLGLLVVGAGLLVEVSK